MRERGRRYREDFHYPADLFEVPAGGSIRVPLSLGSLRKRYGRRTLNVRVEVHINQRANPYRIVRAVRYLKMRV